jgi:hypothetical protein
MRNITLRSSYKKLSVSEAQSMPNVSIRKIAYGGEHCDEIMGFFGHSTINHDYNLKTVRGYETPFISGDVVVVDNATGLMWHQGGSKFMNWNKAKEWVEDLNSEGYAGYNDWRLPTVDEAISLLESKKKGNLYIDPIFSKEQDWIWTGDKFEDEDGSEAAWRVDFYNGRVYWYRSWINHATTMFVRFAP